MNIPDDVMKAARRVASDAAFRLCTIYGGGQYDQGTIDIIARAIMAERERCARVAEGAEISIPLAPGLPDGAQIARKHIVAAIRRGDA